MAQLPALKEYFSLRRFEKQSHKPMGRQLLKPELLRLRHKEMSDRTGLDSQRMHQSNLRTSKFDQKPLFQMKESESSLR